MHEEGEPRERGGLSGRITPQREGILRSKTRPLSGGGKSSPRGKRQNTSKESSEKEKRVKKKFGLGKLKLTTGGPGGRGRKTACKKQGF